jgi:hypothetical protein
LTLSDVIEWNDPSKDAKGQLQSLCCETDVKSSVIHYVEKEEREEEQENTRNEIETTDEDTPDKQQKE